MSRMSESAPVASSNSSALEECTRMKEVANQLYRQKKFIEATLSQQAMQKLVESTEVLDESGPKRC